MRSQNCDHIHWRRLLSVCRVTESRSVDYWDAEGVDGRQWRVLSSFLPSRLGVWGELQAPQRGPEQSQRPQVHFGQFIFGKTLLVAAIFVLLLYEMSDYYCSWGRIVPQQNDTFYPAVSRVPAFTRYWLEAESVFWSLDLCIIILSPNKFGILGEWLSVFVWPFLQTWNSVALSNDIAEFWYTVRKIGFEWLLFGGTLGALWKK